MKCRVPGGAGSKKLKIPNLHSQALSYSAYDQTALTIDRSRH